MNDLEVYKKAISILGGGENIAVITVISTTGSTPGKTGYKMLVWGKNGETISTVGGGLTEANVINIAKNILPKTENQVAKFDLDGTEDDEKGICGGSIELLIETFDLSGTNIVINKDYQKGQLSSLIAAIEDTPQETDAILVCLVDNPFITKNVINKIIAEFKETNNPIIVPVFNGQREHPTLFSRSLFSELVNAPKEQGARYVLHSNAEKVLELETSESTILTGIDTPEDYRFQFGANP